MKKTNEVVDMTVEIDYPGFKKGEYCGECVNRFKCWTNRGFLLRISEFTMQSSMTGGGDRYKLKTKVPECFRCGNMVGSNMIIHMTIGMQKQEIRSIIMEQKIYTDSEHTPMTIEMEAVSAHFV